MNKSFLFLLSFFCLMGLSSRAQFTRTFIANNHSYVLTMDSSLSPDGVNYEFRVHGIFVTGTKKPQKQDIKIRDTVILPWINTPVLFLVEDANFDGYDDLLLLAHTSAGPNVTYISWFYNPKTEEYVRNTSLDEITSPEFDAKTKTVYSGWRDGCCRRGNTTYKYDAGRLVIIDQKEVVDNPESKDRTYVHKKLVKGSLVEVERDEE